MPHGYGTLVAELNDALTRQRYNRVVVHNYCRNADYFLAYLAARKVALEAVTPADVMNYLRFAVRQISQTSWPRSSSLLYRHSQIRNPRAAEARVEALATRTCGRRWRTSLSRGVRTVSDVAAGGTRARHGFGRRLAVGSSKFLCLAHQAFERQFCRPDRPRSRYLHGHAGSRADAEILERCRRAASVAAERQCELEDVAAGMAEESGSRVRKACGMAYKNPCSLLGVYVDFGRSGRGGRNFVPSKLRKSRSALACGSKTLSRRRTKNHCRTTGAPQHQASSSGRPRVRRRRRERK
jgi:hypothetical protein